MALDSVMSDGFGGPGRASVTPQGRQRTSGIIEPGNADATIKEETVPASTTELVGENKDRVAIQIQNTGSAPLYIHYGSGSATTADYRIDAGVTYQFPPGASSAGAIQAISTGAGTKAVVVEFNRDECARQP